MVLIGTYKAIPIVSSEFRLARRGSGQGDMVWDRMSYTGLPNKKTKTDGDQDWPVFIEQLWDLQYVRNECSLNDELSEALYEVSYGVTDLAIRIYMAAQIRAIETGHEEITTDLIRSAYRDDFRLVNRILETLKSGDISPLPMLDDVLPPTIQPIHTMPSEAVRHKQEEEVSSSAQREKASAPANNQGDVRQRPQARSPVRKLIVGRDNITPPIVKKTKTSRKKKAGAADFEQDDLRGVVLRGNEAKPPLDAYQALKEAGYIQAAAEFL